MILYPAIDLQNGQCVRLKRGNFEEATVYESDPVKQAHRFAQSGARWIHLVDLDGAKGEALQQFPLIEKIVQETRLNLQVGGGIRTHGDIEALFKAGAARVVIGSLAIKNPALVKEWLVEFGGDKIVLAMDVRLGPMGRPEILTKGWQEDSHQSLWETLTLYKNTKLKTILCTDVDRDGMLSGTNCELYVQIKKFWPNLEILASGGVTSMKDLSELADQGIEGAIIGKAIYEGKIDLAHAIIACT